MPAPGRGEAVRRRHPDTAPPDAALARATAPAGERAASRDGVRPARRPPRPRRAGDSVTTRPPGMGLTAAGAAVFTVGGTLIGAFVNHLATGGLGVLFAVAFLVSTILVAWTVRAQDRVAAVIAPPIAFAVSVVLVGAFLGDHGDGYLLRTLIYKAGLLWGGTALAAVIVLVKRRAPKGPDG